MQCIPRERETHTHTQTHYKTSSPNSKGQQYYNCFTCCGVVQVTQLIKKIKIKFYDNNCCI